MKRTTIKYIYKYTRYLEDLSNRRINFNGRGTSKGINGDTYNASIRVMHKVFKIMSRIKRNLRYQAKSNYMHLFDPYLHEAYQSPKMAKILRRTVQRVFAQERNADTRKEYDRYKEKSNNSKPKQPTLFNPNKK